MDLVSDLKKSYDEIISVFYDITEDMTSTFNEKKVIDVALKILKKIVNYEAISVLTYHKKNEMYILKREANYNRELKKMLNKMITDGLVEWAIKTGKPFITRENLDEIKTNIIIPLMYKEELLGVIIFHTKEDENYFTQNVLKILTIISNQLSINFENINLYNNLQKRNKKQEELKNYMNNIIKSMTSGIIVLDKENIVRVINERAEKLLQMKVEKYIHKKINYSDFNQEFMKKIEKLHSRTLEGKISKEKEIEYELEDGTYLPLGVTTQLLKNKGKMQGMIYVFRDLRESKELEELKRIDKLKDEFLSMVSHELRTPLTSIKAYTETLIFMAEEKEDEEELDFLNIINEESDRLGRLINDVLDLSKIEAGKMNFIIKEEKVEKLIKIAERNMKGHADKKNIKLIVDCEENLPSVLVDKDRTMQVLSNLINNAIKFTEESGEVKIRAKKKDENFIKLSIKDTGVGIEKENLEMVFEKFKQAENILTRSEGGTGLGLPICKNIIEYYGGEIWVESEFGKGSEFFFTLPTKK
ncbi:MAG: hypothetical protein B6I28_00835 [Fusobacteriia bacterium 4572_132]|nr:MAG: hypothetical protein B6I28_00835 [Fusobacteriia bacterium 4572_132]